MIYTYKRVDDSAGMKRSEKYFRPWLDRSSFTGLKRRLRHASLEAPLCPRLLYLGQWLLYADRLVQNRTFRTARDLFRFRDGYCSDRPGAAHNGQKILARRSRAQLLLSSPVCGFDRRYADHKRFWQA